MANCRAHSDRSVEACFLLSVIWSYGGVTYAKVHDIKMQKSPVALKGLKILIEVTLSMEISKLKILERLKHHIEQHYTIAIAPNPENGSDKEASGEESETKLQRKF